MEKVIELIKERESSYITYKSALEHDLKTAKLLGYDIEAKAIESDIQWVKDIISDLTDILKKIDNETKTNS
jgi:hypothetical protein